MWFRRVRGALAMAAELGLLAGLLAFALGTETASAQGDIYTVRAVAVDETAETAAARQAAIAAGHQTAFERLVERLVPEAQKGQVPVLGPGLVEFYVLDFSVNNERTSTVRYLAELTFRFNPEEVRTLLRNSGVGFAETRSKPLLVLGLYEAEGEAPRLWLEPNPWRGAWAQRPLDDGLVPLRVPLGDLRDVASIDAERAVAGDSISLSAIAEIYGASAVLVTQATVSGDPLLGVGQLTVVSTRHEPGRALVSTRENIVQLPDEAAQDFFTRAAGMVDAAVQEDWKAQNVLQFSNERSIIVYVPLGGLTDWLEVSRRLERIAAIQKSNVNTLSRKQAELEITFVGDEQRLTRARAQRDLFLSLREDSNWELTLTAASANNQPPTSTIPAAPQPQ